MAADEPNEAAGVDAVDAERAAEATATQQPPLVKFVGQDSEADDSDDDEPSDDDEEDEDEDDSDTYIALPDGKVTTADIENPLVSRLGGPAAFLPLRTLPPYPATILCPNPVCAQPMALLFQIFAPRDGSAFDRCLHVWGCARRTCNGPRAAGSSTGASRPSLRVVRTLTYNPRWAAKLAKQRACAEEKERLKAEREKATASAQASTGGKNPFSLQGSQPATPGGGMLFGGDSDSEDDDGQDDDESEGDEAAEQAERLAEELQIKATLDEHRRIRTERRQRALAAAKDAAAAGEEDDQLWPDAADSLAYQPAQYLSTIPEPYAEDEDDKAAAAKAEAASTLDGGSGGKGASEGYERQLLSGVTSTFTRFLERVRREPTQVLRYAWDGVPLPYARRLITRTELDDRPTESDKKSKRTILDAPACERCGAPRVFEVQLMPNLVNVLKPSTLSSPASAGADKIGSSNAADELDEAEAAKADVGYTPLERAERARRRQVARALGRAPGDGGDKDGREVVGLGWATAWIFVCSADCCRPRAGGTQAGAQGEDGEDADGRETWAEEWVAVEFEEL